jgi:hypothetical protein
MMLFGPAAMQLLKAVYVLFEGKSAAERGEIAEEIVELVRSKARGDRPALREDSVRIIRDREGYFREMWARAVASDLISAALGASERVPSSGPPPSPDQQVLLREIIKLALWHMKNAARELRELIRYIEIERLKQPHPVMLVIGTFAEEPDRFAEQDKLEFADVRWMEISSYLKRVSENGTKPVKQIEFQGERLDMTSVHRWRAKVLNRIAHDS